jgi:hypothetical protein
VTRPIVVLESPLAGRGIPNAAAPEVHIAYGRACLADSLRRGEAPVASHLLYALPGVLDDAKEDERKLGMTAGWAFYNVAAKCVVYEDMGVSNGMIAGIARAKAAGVPVEIRKLEGWVWG